MDGPCSCFTLSLDLSIILDVGGKDSHFVRSGKILYSLGFIAGSAIYFMGFSVK